MRLESNPRPFTVKTNALSIAPRQIMSKIICKLITGFNTFVMKFYRWTLFKASLIYEELKDIFEENKQGFDGD